MPIILSLEDVAEGLETLAVLDDRLHSVIARAGPVPLRLATPGFEGLANIIVSQMVSKASAAAIWGRLMALTGEPMTARSLLALDGDAMRAAGLSGAKVTALRAAAEAETSGILDPERICRIDARDANAQLTAIKGIGPWTADVYLMFCAGHPDIFPVGDVALQNAVMHALALEIRPKGKDLAAIADIWSPWRSVAARLFWAYYSREMRRATDPLG